MPATAADPPRQWPAEPTLGQASNLGTISYGLYLLHMLCKNVVVKVAGFAGVQLGAGLSFNYLEWRLLRMKRRFERSTSPALRTA